MTCKAYPQRRERDERAFVAPCLALLRGDAPRRDRPLCVVFNGLRRIGRTGVQ